LAKQPAPKPAKLEHKSYELVISSIEKSFGEGTLARKDADTKIQTISTGAATLDRAIGPGGIPRGRITEIYGPESSGKTTLCLHVIANAQKAGGLAAIIDAEHALDLDYARRIGVDTDNLLVCQPDNGEQALDVCAALIETGQVDVIVVDSVAALVPRAELEGDMGAAHVGLQARLMSQAMRKLTAMLARTNCALVFINQLREKVGVMYGSPEVTTGGKALKFYASVRLDIRRREQIKDGEEVSGNAVRVKVVKNKIGPPFREATFDILFNEGIDKFGTLLDLAVDVGVVEKSGAWYKFGEQKLGHGRENARLFLREDPALTDAIRAKVDHGNA
jgi:recombination protein RecA